jgi:hypothetical protein
MAAHPTPAASRVSYDGRRFRPTGPDGDGAAAALELRRDGDSAAVEPGGRNRPTTVGRYHQDGDLVWAEFSGPTVPVGRLVGTCRPDGVIDAAYCMIGRDGQTIAGTCESTPTLHADGRMRVTERWQRMDGSSGVSYLEEIVE